MLESMAMTLGRCGVVSLLKVCLVNSAQAGGIKVTFVWGKRVVRVTVVKIKTYLTFSISLKNREDYIVDCEMALIYRRQLS